MKTLISIAGLESGTVRATTAFPYENQIKRIDNKRDGGVRPEAIGRI